MATINGQEVKVRWASNEEEKLYKEYQEIKEKIKALGEQQKLIFDKLTNSSLNQAVVTDVTGELRTFYIGEQSGKFVYFDKYGFVSDAKTTKKDQQTLPEREVKATTNSSNPIEEALSNFKEVLLNELDVVMKSGQWLNDFIREGRIQNWAYDLHKFISEKSPEFLVKNDSGNVEKFIFAFINKTIEEYSSVEEAVEDTGMKLL